jgi:undecaprenyl-diphosphatase
VGHVLIEVAHLGSAGVAFAVALLAGGIWAIRRRRPAPLAVLGLAYGGGAIVGLAVKVLVRRGQSGLPGGLSSLTQLGFPSGHATLAAAVYGTMAALLARRGARWHRILAGGLVGLAVVIGVARVYNGQHETTDVIAGWILGGLWAWTVATIVTGLERRTASAPAGREHEAGPCVAL